MIIAKGLKKKYGPLEVLRGIDIEIAKAEVVTVVGKSGAGKSTLLQILGTLDQPDQGEVNIAGQNILQLNNKAIADFRNKHIGFIFQFHHLLPEFTALENTMMPAMLGGESRKKAQIEAEKWLEYMGLSQRALHRPSELSGGEQQRVAVARALINRPEVVFADEPSGNLDTQTSTDLHKLFFQLRQDFQQTFFIVTHNVELAAMSDRQIHMADGLLV